MTRPTAKQTAEEFERWRTERGIVTFRLHPDDVEAVAEAVFEKLRRANTEKLRRGRRPCGVGNAVPRCMGSAALGPDGCTCR